jgi:peroxiredoxin
MLWFRKLLNWIPMGQSYPRTLDTGDRAPGFELPLAGGGRRSLTELLEAGPVLLAFYKASCPTCQLTLPYLQRLQGGRFQIYAVSQNEADVVEEFNSAFDIDLPTLIDPAGEGYVVSNAFGITHVPTMFLIEQDQSISWAWSGFHKAQLESLAERAGRRIFEAADRVPESKFG